MRYSIANKSGTSSFESSSAVTLLGLMLMLLTAVGPAMAGEIDLYQPPGTSVADGGSRDFGTVNVGTSRIFTFVIRNTGNSPLNLTGNPKVVIGGAHAADFVVTAQPSTPLPAPTTGGPVTVLNPSFETPSVGGGGGYQYEPGGATWTFGDGPSGFGGAGIARNGSLWYLNGAPEGIQAAFIAGDGYFSQVIPFPTLGAYLVRFSIVRGKSPMVPGNVEVRMDGTTLGTVSISSQTNDVWQTFDVPYSCTTTGNHTLTFAGTLITGGSRASCIDAVQIRTNGAVVLETSFQVRFAPTARGARTATLSIPNDDSNENPYNLTLTGTGFAEPEIAVFTGASTNAADERFFNAGIYLFPDTWVGRSSATQIFTIKNIGNANLENLAVTKNASHPGDFNLGALGATTLPPQATTTFTISFSPTTTGTRFSAVNILSSDADENPFPIYAYGTGSSIAQQPTNASVCVGNTAQFQVALSEFSEGSYQWQRRAPGASTFVNIVNATNATYTTPAAVAGDDGAAFRVVVSVESVSVTSAVALLYVVAVTAPTAVYNFNSGLGGGTVYGAATASSGALELNASAAGSAGAFLMPVFAPDRFVRGFAAKFKVAIVAGNGYADGFSFNWATDLPEGIYPMAEEGEGSGLRICFDTYSNGPREGPAIEVKWGNTLIAQHLTNNNFLAGNAGEFADVSIRLNTDGTLDLNYRCVPIFMRLPLPQYTPMINARFGLGARTGGVYERHVIDDLNLQLYADPVRADTSLIDASIPGDAIMATSATSPAGYGATNAIDNTATGKYLNFDKLNAGMTIVPAGQRPVRGLTLMSAEDVPDRDPSSFVIEGSDNGVTFTRIASNAVPPFPARHSIQSFAFANTNVFNVYRVVFPTVSNAAAANSMQIAQVELLYHGEITSPSDAVSITLPPGAVDVRGVGSLFDRQLDGIRKLEVAPITGGNTVIHVVPAAGTSVLKGFELIGAADDFTFPQRRPGSAAVAGSNDGTNYTNLATMTPAAPSSNLQIQEFSTFSNTTAFARYRITFGPPVSGDRLQVGEMRLFGEVVTGNPSILSIRASGNNVLVSWPNSPGYSLQSNNSLSDTNWTLVGIAPVASNGVNTVTIPISQPAGFYRLRK